MACSLGYSHILPFKKNPGSSAWSCLCQGIPPAWKLLSGQGIHMEERKLSIVFVDLRLPLNIYLFNQFTRRFKVGLGKVREVTEKFHSCVCREPSILVTQELQEVKCCCVVLWLRQIEPWLNSIKLAPI